MEEKYESFKQKILKLNELALRGEEGEKPLMLERQWIGFALPWVLIWRTS